MGAFEDYVNANLGIRKPLITDSGPPSQSSKAAGIIGSQYIDSDTYFLYEKTGENNSSDWVKIAYVGQTRGQPPEGIEGSVQFKSGDFFAGSPDLTYDYSSGLLSGQSGDFNYIYANFITGETGHFGEELAIGDPAQDGVFVVDNGNIETAGRANFSGPITAATGYLNELIVSGDAYISGDFYVSGTTYINEVVDTTVSGTVSGYTGVFDTVSGQKGAFTQSLTISGEPVTTGSRDYPVLTGVEFDASTNIMSFFRDLGASNIHINLSSLAGPTYQSTLLWEENNGDLVLLNDETKTSNPATQLFENSGVDNYTVRENVFASNTEAAQYFEETGVDITLTTSSYLPATPISYPIITAPYGGDASLAGAEDNMFLTTDISNGSSFSVIKYDFGGVTTVNGYNIKGLKFSQSCTFGFEGSDDNSNWSSIWSTFANNSTLMDYTDNGAQSYRYYRLMVLSFGINGQAELDFIEFT